MDFLMYSQQVDLGLARLVHTTTSEFLGLRSRQRLIIEEGVQAYKQLLSDTKSSAFTAVGDTQAPYTSSWSLHHAAKAVSTEHASRSFSSPRSNLAPLATVALGEQRELDHELAQLPSSSSTEEDERLQPYRDWFLAHFDYPYINKTTRSQLRALVPHHRTDNQTTTWLINARRRSGWSQLFKHHANGDRKLFKRLLDLTDSEVTKWQVEESVRNKIQEVRNWFDKAGAQVVRAGIQDVVDRADEIAESAKREAEEKRKASMSGLPLPHRQAQRQTKPAAIEGGFRMPASRREDVHSSEFFAGLVPQRQGSNGSSSTDSSLSTGYRDYSGVSRFSIDTDSTASSSIYDSSSSQYSSSPDLHSSTELTLPPLSRYEPMAQPDTNANGDIVITPVTPHYPQSVQQPTQYFSTLADWAVAQTAGAA
ncbi:hypothetical protein OIO90_001016 [Microbotryomycetes sp. JL221]|nr:hypothetical protein OIO90_001016 [Microbotryomycetes sp. JL221]